MHRIVVGILVVLLAGCTAPAEDGSPRQSGRPSASVSSGRPSALPSSTPNELASSVPTPAVSTPALVLVTFRLTVTGTMPADAAFALESGVVGGEGGAVYLCSYYGGWPVCESGATYQEAHSFPPGTRVRYRFWRELDANGTSEEIEAGEITVGVADQVVSVRYDIQP